MEKELSSIKRFTMDDYTGWKNNIYVWSQYVEKNCPLHWHDHYEIEYVINGSGKQIFNGTEYKITPGVVHILAPTDFHEWIVEEKLEVIKFNFREDDVDPFILNTLIGLCGNTALAFSGEEKKLMDDMFSVSLRHAKLYKNSSNYELMVKKLLEGILLNMIEKIGSSGKQSDGNFIKTTDNIRRVLMYVHKHFKEPLELNTVAEFAHYSPQYMSKVFHSVMGVTFKEYITNLRMNYAAALIINTEMGVSDISREAGFGTRQNFTKEFKKFYSCSPTEYRMENQKNSR